MGAIEMVQRRGLRPPKNPARVRKPRVWLPYQGPPLQALWVTKHVPLDFERSSVRQINECSTCGGRQYETEGVEKSVFDLNKNRTAVVTTHTPRAAGKGFYIDHRELDGVGIFRLIELEAMILCTDPVKKCIEQHGFTNIAFLEYGETF